MILIAGLGNPDVQYLHTRHNVGFMVVDQLAENLKINFKQKPLFWIANKIYRNIEVLIVKPKTYMNLSGKAIHALLLEHKIDLSNILIICDDMNLPFGTIRIRAKGSDGGQKGLRSIISHLGTQDFPRLRIGIGSQFDNATDFVLSKFSLEEQKNMPLILDWAEKAIRYFILNGAELTMNRFNRNCIEANKGG